MHSSAGARMKLFRLSVLHCAATLATALYGDASGAQQPAAAPDPRRHAQLHSRRLGHAYPLRYRLQFAGRHESRQRWGGACRALSPRRFAGAARRHSLDADLPRPACSLCRAALKNSATCARKNCTRRACSICPILTSFPADASTRCTAGTVTSFFSDWKPTTEKR